MIAVCGLHCETCPIYLATVNDDQNQKERIVAELSLRYPEYHGEEALQTTDIQCHGCQTRDGVLFTGCVRCPMRACCQEKQFQTCAECSAYLECEMINSFFSQEPQAKVVLDAINALK